MASPTSCTAVRNATHTELPECLDGLHGVNTERAMRLERRSYLGLFVRRARLSYEMLLDHERIELVDLCRAWRDGRATALTDEWQGTHSFLRQSMRLPAPFGSGARANAAATIQRPKTTCTHFSTIRCRGATKSYTSTLCSISRASICTQRAGRLRALYVPSLTQALDEAILLARTVDDAECMRACDRYVAQLRQLAGPADPTRPGAQKGW